MRVLAKFNRGLLLALLVLAGLAVYLVQLDISQRQAVPEIKRIAEDYLKKATAYAMLPEKYRRQTPAMPASELNGYIDKASSELKAFYPEEELYYEYTLKELANSLRNQAEGKDVIYDYQKNVAEYKDIEFDGYTVTLTLLTNTSVDRAGASGIHSAKTAQVTDTLTLKKIGGEWKVIYASLEMPQTDNGYGGDVMNSYIFN